MYNTILQSTENNKLSVQKTFLSLGHPQIMQQNTGYTQTMVPMSCSSQNIQMQTAYPNTNPVNLQHVQMARSPRPMMGPGPGPGPPARPMMGPGPGPGPPIRHMVPSGQHSVPIGPIEVPSYGRRDALLSHVYVHPTGGTNQTPAGPMGPMGPMGSTMNNSPSSPHQ